MNIYKDKISKLCLGVSLVRSELDRHSLDVV